MFLAFELLLLRSILVFVLIFKYTTISAILNKNDFVVWYCHRAILSYPIDSIAMSVSIHFLSNVDENFTCFFFIQPIQMFIKSFFFIYLPTISKIHILCSTFCNWCVFVSTVVLLALCHLSQNLVGGKPRTLKKNLNCE